MNAILEDLDRLFKRMETAVIVIVVAGLMLWVGRCTARKDAVVQERIKVLTQRVTVAETLYVHDTLTAYRTRIRYDSTRIRDTLVRNDTVFIPRAVADTAIHACTNALRDCDRIRLLNDSLTRALVKSRPGFWSRLGCNVGPSAVATRDGSVKAGVGATCGIKVWP